MIVSPDPGAAWLVFETRCDPEVPHQLSGALRAFLATVSPQPVIVAEDSAISSFAVGGGLGRCFVQGAGALGELAGGTDAFDFLSSVQRELDVQAIYFPLLYGDISIAQSLLQAQGGRRLRRRPSPVIDWELGGADVWARCERKLGSRARRRRRRFEASGAEIVTLEGPRAVRSMLTVEQGSWKTGASQDMISRGQADFYAALLRSSEASLRVALESDEPIAYRLDMRVRNIVYCLKWSYVDDYRALSPGFYLLAVDLVDCYRNDGVVLVDLFGAPDMLKSALASGDRERFDLVWPDGAKARRLLAERAQHDKIAAEAYNRGDGIRRTYRDLTSSSTIERDGT